MYAVAALRAPRDNRPRVVGLVLSGNHFGYGLPFASAACPSSDADAKVPQAGTGRSGIAWLAIPGPHLVYGLMRRTGPVPIAVL